MGSLQAASVVTSGDVALQMAPKDGIIVFTYAEGWDGFSKKLSNKLMANEQIKKASGDAAFLAYPSYDLPTEAQEKQLTELRGELEVPRVLCYPAMIIFDSKGRHATTIQGRDLTAYTTGSIAKLLARRIEKTKAQSAMLAKAETATGVEQAKLLGQASNMPDMVAPKDYLKKIKELDPEDTSGYTKGLSTDEWKVSAEIAELTSMEEIITYVDKVLADKSYKTKTKQAAIARMIAQWRTMGTRDQIPTMAEYAKKMIALDATNYHAKSAEFMLHMWFRPFTLETGWFAGMMPADDRLVMAEGDVPITEPGTYTITIQHTGGRYALTMTSVTLFDGDKEVAKDAHEGVAGDKPKNTVYTLVVPQKVAKPRIGFTFNQGNKNATEGKFILERVK